MAIVGVDIGTQSLKAIVVDDDLSLRGEAAAAYQPTFPRPGWAEQDATLWLGALKPAITRALASARCAPEEVHALGVSGQLDGCVATSRSGELLGPCLIWMDRRATAEMRDAPDELIRRRSGLIPDPTHMAAKIKWMSAQLERTDVLWHQPVSFLVAKLTGRRVMDHALASTTMLYDPVNRNYCDELLDAFSIDRASMPALSDAADVAGELTPDGAALTGLPVGVTLAVGTGDDFASMLGGGIVAPGAVGCVLGTAEVVGAVHPAAVHDAAGLVESHAFAGAVLVSNPGWLSGGSVTWFLDVFRLASPSALDAEASRSPAGANDLLFLPALSGAMAPRWEPRAKGAFYGLTASHSRADCARALLEGCAFAMRDVVDRLGQLGVATDVVRVMGGGAASAVWAQIRADVWGGPVDALDATSPPARGAALLAAVASGRFASVDSAAAATAVRPLARFEPDPAHRDAYARGYARYRRLFDALEPMFVD
jgi:xylulokinase